ncbi:MAG TPA: DoxX family protein [Methylocella sp.]|nr:DoxX family protein [Methylocella sp.]
MLDLPPFSPAWSARLLGVLRIVTGLLLLQHGTAKLFGFPHIEMFNNLAVFSLLGLSGILEFFGGLLLVAGVLTRLVAFILSGEMAVAYFLVHAPKGFFPVLNQGELAALYCFVFLYLSVVGGGAFSLLSEEEASAHKD